MSDASPPSRTIAFFDGQNLFHAAKEAFGTTYPNYDPVRLAQRICDTQGWTLRSVRFYTGVPDATDNPFWHHFWDAKLAVLGTRGVFTFRRSLRYQNKTVNLPDGTQYSYLVGHEKGIDVRIALDAVRLALDDAYDVGLIFSQDQDLSEVADEIRLIARREKRWIKLASAFPSSPTYRNRRGIDKTDWIPIDRSMYHQCIDPRDYRRKS
jgi:uncharacterized LabA/DUF88 family protein